MQVNDATGLLGALIVALLAFKYGNSSCSGSVPTSTQEVRRAPNRIDSEVIAAEETSMIRATRSLLWSATDSERRQSAEEIATAIVKRLPWHDPTPWLRAWKIVGSAPPPIAPSADLVLALRNNSDVSDELVELATSGEASKLLAVSIGLGPDSDRTAVLLCALAHPNRQCREVLKSQLRSVQSDGGFFSRLALLRCWSDDQAWGDWVTREWSHLSEERRFWVVTVTGRVTSVAYRPLAERFLSLVLAGANYAAGAFALDWIIMYSTCPADLEETVVAVSSLPSGSSFDRFRRDAMIEAILLRLIEYVATRSPSRDSLEAVGRIARALPARFEYDSTTVLAQITGSLSRRDRTLATEALFGAAEAYPPMDFRFSRCVRAVEAAGLLQEDRIVEWLEISRGTTEVLRIVEQLEAVPKPIDAALSRFIIRYPPIQPGVEGDLNNTTPKERTPAPPPIGSAVSSPDCH